MVFLINFLPIRLVGLFSKVLILVYLIAVDGKSNFRIIMRFLIKGGAMPMRV